MSGELLHPDWIRWLTALKDRAETLVAISAEQVVTGTLDPSTIPSIPWGRVLKTGSSLGDLETRNASDLSSGTLLDARMPALTGDVSSTVGTVATTLATVNPSPGTFGSGTKIPLITVNGKGLVTLVTEQPIQTGALTRVNDTNVTATLGGTPATALLKAVSITLGWTGLLGLSRGGTHADLSATGGAGKYLKQASAGADVTVSSITAAEITAGAALTKVDDTNITLTLGGSPASALLAATSLTLGWTGTLSVARGGTGGGTAFTAGSVVFAGPSGVYAQDNANLFWDDTNNRLGIGTASPSVGVDAFAQVNIHGRFGVGSGYMSLGNSGNGGFDVGYNIVHTASAEVWNYAVGDTASLIYFNNGGFEVFGTAVAAGGGTPIAFTTFLTITNAGKVGLNNRAPTAYMHLRPGSATANTAPLKFTSGTLLTAPEAGAQEFLTDDYFATITTGTARKAFVLDDGTRLTSGKVPVASTNGRLIDGPTLGAAGLKIAAIQASARATAQTAAVASIATFANGAADGSYIVSANVNVTTSTTHSFSVQVDYTDETNTSQTLTLTFAQLTAALVSVITNVTGAGPYEGLALQIRCKASTSITIKTTGTFTIVTYNVEGLIQQVA